MCWGENGDRVRKGRFFYPTFGKLFNFIGVALLYRISLLNFYLSEDGFVETRIRAKEKCRLNKPVIKKYLHHRGEKIFFYTAVYYLTVIVTVVETDEPLGHLYVMVNI